MQLRAAAMRQSNSMDFTEFIAVVNSIERNINSCLRLAKAREEVIDNKTKSEKSKHTELEAIIAKCCDWLRQFNDAYGAAINTTTDHEIFAYKQMFQMTNFAYAPAKLSGYQTETRYNGFVSHIDPNNIDNSMLFIIDMNFPSVLNLLEEAVEYISHIPMPGVVFAVDLGVDGLFRAVRDNVMSQTLQSASVMLIDTGETLKVSALPKTGLYKLSKKAQSLPAFAIPCKAAKIFDVNGREIPISTKEFESLKHETVEFVMVGIDQPLLDMMLVNIYKKPSTITAPRSWLNPFAEEFIMPTQNGAVSNDRVAATSRECYSEVHKMNAVKSTTASNAAMDCAKGRSINECIPKTGVQLTERELEELYEEPFNTSNALVAVMGYAPRDDAVICRFTNPKTGKCFKGNNCRLEHVQIMKDGWTRDRRPTMSQVWAAQRVPEERHTVDILPTFVISVEEFYAYVPCACDCVAKKNPKELKALINTPEKRQKYVQIQKRPDIRDLVFVKQWRDQFYRAQVIDHINEETHVLFFVDYGYEIKVCVDQIYEWSTDWDYVPFLARRCHLANVRMRWPNDQEAIEEMMNRIEAKKMTASIECVSDDLFVRLTDVNGLDVGQQLCEDKLAVSGNFVPAHNDEYIFPAI